MPDHQPRSHTEISRSFEEFSESHKVLESPQEMRRFAGNWVAVHQRKIVAVAPELRSVRKLLEEGNIPLGTVVVRFIEENGMIAS